ncbi:hypothetical protein HOLleu_32563 [Holothuria leucospilota]|uniref:DUF4371 domain-containing protein n=1 Tax=Holothuria leucospilota TaxID=206669 RepID=A0A9Q1H018_HOLLE|nr:hypothetical protein HOLleu_32563 [Holothuria leucospilota]
MERTTLAYKLKEGVAEVAHQRTVKDLKETPFSINLDECTNRANNKVLTVLVSYFSESQGPRVEQSFSIMNDVICPKTNRLQVSTFGAIQTVKYDLQASHQTSIERYYREDRLKSPVDKHLCHHMQTSHSQHKQKQEAKRKAKLQINPTATKTKSTTNVHKVAKRIIQQQKAREEVLRKKRSK